MRNEEFQYSNFFLDATLKMKQFKVPSAASVETLAVGPTACATPEDVGKRTPLSHRPQFESRLSSSVRSSKRKTIEKQRKAKR